MYSASTIVINTRYIVRRVHGVTNAWAVRIGVIISLANGEDVKPLGCGIIFLEDFFRSYQSSEIVVDRGIRW